jgi:adenylosuccinate synthase
LQEVYGQPPQELEELLERAKGWAEQYKALIIDQVPLIAQALEAGRSILLEGQLGALRDLDWGTYPFVTSSTTVAGGGGVGGGVPPMCITQVMGVVKAYTTAVGEGRCRPNCWTKQGKPCGFRVASLAPPPAGPAGSAGSTQSPRAMGTISIALPVLP